MPFVKDGVAYIPLQPSADHKHRFALIDVEDMPRVSAIKWMAVTGGLTLYVRATNGSKLAKHHENLANFIMRSSYGERFDHENGNGLDNRKLNLRPATEAENSRNRVKTTSPHVTSRFKGVMLTGAGRWTAAIVHDGVKSVLGTYDAEEEAARAYDEAAIRLFGQFAKTNADMGLYDNAQPVRALDGHDEDARQLGEYVPAVTTPEGWQHVLGVHNPDRQRFSPVVGLTMHRRQRVLLYRLADGSVVSPKAYVGTHPTEAELEQYRAEYRAHKAAKRAA